MGEILRQERRILAVDDCLSCRILVQRYLQNSPHSVVFAEDGASAVELFAASPFDLILMDKQMPGMDGLAATRAIRALERDQNRNPVFIVALTADSLPRDLEASYAAGCDAHLTKPLSKQLLLDTIEKVPLHQASQQLANLADSLQPSLGCKKNFILPARSGRV